MKFPKYSEILKTNDALAATFSGNEYSVYVLSNIVVSPMKEILEYSLRVHGINAHITLGDYDNIVQDSIKAKDSKLVIVFWELSNIVDGLQYKANLMKSDEIESLHLRVKSEMDFVFSSLSDISLVLFNKFTNLFFNYNKIKRDAFDDICGKLNKYLEEKLPSNAVLVDIEKVIAGLSVEKCVDFRYYYSSKALYRIEFYKEYSNFIRPCIMSANGMAKKALIFDCDNTLWKGILGEDGFNGIEMSGTTPQGAVFEEVQCIALEQNRKGIIIGLCSKNNPEDVENVITEHPDMKIKKENITIKKVNWKDKVSNLKAIARDLNIGVDSLVFVDDSDFEINYVKQYLPEITVLRVPSDIFEYPMMLRKTIALFYNISEAKEDLKRIRMYAEQASREEFRGNFSNLEDFLKSLGLHIYIYCDDESVIPRMAQMMQKTNQFNLTTKRYTEADMRNFVRSDDYRVFAIEVKDNFGSYGITGLVIIKLRLEEVTAELDTLLLSCRVIGRNIEHAFFDFIIERLKELGIMTLHGKYFKTPKNGQVQDLCESYGMTLVSYTDKEKCYRIDLVGYRPKHLDYIEVGRGGKN